MALTFYLTQTANLLQNPAAPAPLYSTASLTNYINIARGQIAGEGQCIRFMGSFSTAANVAVTPFANVTLPSAVADGVFGILTVRTGWVVGGPNVYPETWEEYNLYDLNSGATGRPARWAQYGEGTYGQIYLAPVPNGVFSMQFDCVCVPVDLANDSTPEAIPYLWTDAIPYYAAYLALLSAQTGARTAEADKMYERYKEFMVRARIGTTPGVLPWKMPQVPVSGGVNPQPQRAG